MDQSNNNEEIIQQLQETNRRLKSVQNVLIGVLISTAVMALVFILLYSKISKVVNMMTTMEDLE